MAPRRFRSCFVLLVTLALVPTAWPAEEKESGKTTDSSSSSSKKDKKKGKKEKKEKKGKKEKKEKKSKRPSGGSKSTKTSGASSGKATGGTKIHRTPTPTTPDSTPPRATSNTIVVAGTVSKIEEGAGALRHRRARFMIVGKDASGEEGAYVLNGPCVNDIERTLGETLEATLEVTGRASQARGIKQIYIRSFRILPKAAEKQAEQGGQDKAQAKE